MNIEISTKKKKTYNFDVSAGLPHEFFWEIEIHPPQILSFT